MTTFRVLMLGYQRVGKTSLLASMYRATQKELAGNYQFQIKPGNDLTSQLLSKAEDNLKCATEYIFGDTIAPTNVLRTFLFQMYSNEQMLFQLEFLDYQGGRLMDSSTSDAATVREWLNTCVAVIIPIDSPSLMESQGEWAELNNEWNNPEGIENIFRSEMIRNSPRLVILSPVKCEKYIQEQRGEALRRKVENVYENLLQYLSAEPDLKNNCVVIAPVQTIGGAVFTGFKQDPNKGIRPTYVNTKGEYKPQDGDQLLRYIARFALARINKENLVRFNEINQKIEEGGLCPPSGARQEKENLTKQIILMKSGLAQFSQSCKQEGAFRIVSGGSLLNS